MTKRRVLMECGHTSTGHDIRGNPVCGICLGINKGASEIKKNLPHLEGREARCSYGCGNKAKSSINLPFFEYRGEGSWSSRLCKTCRLARVAHNEGGSGCKRYEPMGGWRYDAYYCGCRGWD